MFLFTPLCLAEVGPTRHIWHHFLLYYTSRQISVIYDMLYCQSIYSILKMKYFAEYVLSVVASSLACPPNSWRCRRFCPTTTYDWIRDASNATFWQLLRRVRRATWWWILVLQWKEFLGDKKNFLKCNFTGLLCHLFSICFFGHRDVDILCNILLLDVIFPLFGLLVRTSWSFLHYHFLLVP